MLWCPLPLQVPPGSHVLEVRSMSANMSAKVTLGAPDRFRNYAARINNGVIEVSQLEPDNSRHCCRWVGIAADMNVMLPEDNTSLPPFCWDSTQATSQFSVWSGSHGRASLPSGGAFRKQPVTLSLQCAATDVTGAMKTSAPWLDQDLFHNVRIMHCCSQINGPETFLNSRITNRGANGA